MMMAGCINEYTTRRNNFELCRYWKRDNEERALDEYVHEVKPSGKFYAKEITAFTNKKQEINNMFMYDETTTSIQTSDTIDISSGDIVEFEGEIWLVLDVQHREIHRYKQFLNTKYKTTFIRIKR